MTGVAVVLCTVPEGEAERLVDQLLAEHRIACANLVGPVRSRYRWEGQIEEAREVLLVMKTASAAVAGLRERIVALHSYDVPEVIELPVSGGADAYLRWVLAEVTLSRA